MNSKGFQLSINMLIVIILGVVILGVGFSIFSKAQTQISSAQETVSEQAQQQLEALLIDGSAPVILPFSLSEVSRGKSAIFNLGISNELGKTKSFLVDISYSGTTANNYAETGNEVDDWILLHSRFTNGFELENNEQEYVPIQITVPKDGVKKGQYGFVVKVYQETETGENLLYGSAQQIYVVV
ncbi:MAG: hypothetical protein ACOCQQ_02065 [Candidatus Nanoarchaeia archaeon]